MPEQTYSLIVRLKTGERLVIPGVYCYAIHGDGDKYEVRISEAKHRIFFNANEIVYIGHEDRFKGMKGEIQL